MLMQYPREMLSVSEAQWGERSELMKVTEIFNVQTVVETKSVNEITEGNA